MDNAPSVYTVCKAVMDDYRPGLCSFEIKGVRPFVDVDGFPSNYEVVFHLYLRGPIFTLTFTKEAFESWYQATTHWAEESRVGAICNYIERAIDSKLLAYLHNWGAVIS